MTLSFPGPTFCSARAKLITSWAPKSNQKNGWVGVSEIKLYLVGRPPGNCKYGCRGFESRRRMSSAKFWTYSGGVGAALRNVLGLAVPRKTTQILVAS